MKGWIYLLTWAFSGSSITCDSGYSQSTIGVQAPCTGSNLEVTLSGCHICTLPVSQTGYNITSSSILNNCNPNSCTPSFGGTVRCDEDNGYSGTVSTTGCTNENSTVTLTGCDLVSCVLPGDDSVVEYVVSDGASLANCNASPATCNVQSACADAHSDCAFVDGVTCNTDEGYDSSGGSSVSIALQVSGQESFACTMASTTVSLTGCEGTKQLFQWPYHLRAGMISFFPAGQYKPSSVQFRCALIFSPQKTCI